MAEYHDRRPHAVWCWVTTGLHPAVPIVRGVLIPSADSEGFRKPKYVGRRRWVALASRMITVDVAEYHDCTDRAVVRLIATPRGYLVRRAYREAFEKSQARRKARRKMRKWK